MAKIPDYNWRRFGTEAIGFKDDVQTVLNFGKYSAQVVSTVPDWSAPDGEFVFFLSGATERIYLRLNTSWVALDFAGVPKAWINYNTVGTVSIHDSVGVNSITDAGVGSTTISWSTNFANTNYTLTCTSIAVAGSTLIANPVFVTVSSAEIRTRAISDNNLTDSDSVHVIAEGNQ